MAWRSPEGGIGGFNAGFDTRGGEQLWQADTMKSTDKGAYEKKPWNLFTNTFGGGTRLTPEAQAYNDALRWKDTNPSYTSGFHPRTLRNLLKQGSEKNEARGLLPYSIQNRLPEGALETQSDWMNQQLLEDEAPEGYKWLAEGGIASTRPGYAWGGGAEGPVGRSPLTRREIAVNRWNAIPAELHDPSTDTQPYTTVGDQMRGEGFLETMSGKKIFPTQMNDWGLEDDQEEIRQKGLSGAYEAYGGAGTGSTYEGGGIASTRPGYAWGGGAKQGSSVTPITGIPWSDKPGLQHKEWKRWNKGLFDKSRHERFERGYLPDRGWYETYQSPFGTQTGMTVEPEWYEQRGHRGFNEGESYAMMQPGAKSSRTPTLDPVSKLYEDEWEAGTFPEAWRPRGLLEDWSDYPFRNDKRRFSNWQEGGAVGLEPGIASLMGYAKGGMVTKVKVPKGQSKWMKKFMNNMRDN